MTTNNNKRTAIANEIATRRFGVEIEFTGISREAAARAAASVLCEGPGGRPVQYLDKWGACSRKVVDAQGRKWAFVSDCTVPGSTYGCEHGEQSCGATHNPSRYRSIAPNRGGEFVTPPIRNEADMETLQEVVRAIRRAGGRVTAECGVHVHVDASDLDTDVLGRVVAMTYSHEELIIGATRVSRWARPTPENEAQRMRRGTSKRDMARAQGCRYRGLNLHSLNKHGTVEFRYFAGTLHAGEIRAYVTFCLAMVGAAINSKRTALKQVTPRYAGDKKHAMSHFLLTRLCLNGAENKNVRKHLLKNLPGTVSGPRRSSR